MKTMEKLILNIFDDEIDAIMDEIPEELWYNSSSDQYNDQQIDHPTILSTW